MRFFGVCGVKGVLVINDVVGDSRVVRAAALILASYLGGIIAFALVRIGFRLLALEGGVHTTLTASKTTTFLLFTGPGRGIAIVLLLLPILVRRPIDSKRIALYLGGTFVLLTVVYIRIQWNGELAHTSRPLGVLLVLTVACVFSILTSVVAPRTNKLLRSMPVRFSVAASVLILVLSVIPAVIGALTILFNDLSR